jgi:ribonuclease VapC
MFVDASALVAILTEEVEGEVLSARLEAARHPFTSPIAVYEAALAIRRKRQRPMATIRADLAAFLKAAGIRLVAVPPAAADPALDAFARYRKGTGHPAQLNMGDCFAYAMAVIHDAPLLFKGDDFALTDIAARE